MKKTWWLAGALGAAVALAAGCGAVVRDAVAREEAVGVVGGYALAGGDASALAPHGPIPGLRPGLALSSKLGLTGEQKERARAIAAKYRGDLRPPNLAASRRELAGLALAPTVDKARLAAFVRARAAELEAQRPARLAMAAELRGVLTPDQRETLAGLLEAGEPQVVAHLEALKGKVLAHATPRLGLTAAQLATIDALHDRAEALRRDPRHEAARRGVAAFVRTGDVAALDAAVPPLAQVLPVAELVEVAASLDQRQRQQIAAHARRFAAARLGPHPF